MAEKVIHYVKVEDNGEFYGYYDNNYVKISSVIPTPNKMQVVESNGFLPIKYIEGDFGGGFTNLTLDSPDTNVIVIVRDTNTTTPGCRLYVYADSWKYVDLS